MHHNGFSRIFLSILFFFCFSTFSVERTWYNPLPDVGHPAGIWCRAGAGVHAGMSTAIAASTEAAYAPPDSHIGVLYVIHGGMDTNTPQYMFDAAVMQFSFDPNHSVYKLVIWNPANWPLVLDTEAAEFTLKYLRMYDFSYDRIGGTDPYQSLSEQQLADMQAELDKKGPLYGIKFEVDWAGYQCADKPDHYPYPRFIYYGPDGPDVGYNLTYCGEDEPNGPWPDCNPERYNVDGPMERLLKKGVSRIIVVDLHVGGVRYSKGYRIYNMAKRVLDEWNTEHGTSIPFNWINDYSSLMERSYPTEPAGWTSTLGYPTKDSHVLLNGSPNPISSDPELATLNVEAIEAGMSATVSDADTGILIMNHALQGDNNEVYDPKMNDTLILNKNIKSQILERHPDMDPDNIVGAYFGRKELNPVNGLVEHSRELRGEVYGYAWLYESDKKMPGDEWGYFCWDALEYLKNRGVKHIVIANPQVFTASVLDMVEMPNQIAREIGFKNWALWATKDYTKYPEAGHPFADYWGVWAYTDCSEWNLNYVNGTSGFNMGATLTGQASGATAVIKWLIGNFTYGTLTLKQVSGTFQGDELITDDQGGSAQADGSATMTSKQECCYVMGGCNDPLRPYPAPRMTPLNQSRSDLDSSIVYDISDYGNLGYYPAQGAPSQDGPVHDQYTGTWAMYSPPSDNPGVGKLLAKHVINAALNPLVYITNGELEGTSVGGSVTFEAHVIGGKPKHTYKWFLQKEGNNWSSVGKNSSTWTWTPRNRQVGTYSIRCQVTDAQKQSGQVMWEGFVVSPKN